MDEAFDRLTWVQKNHINKQMFAVAYNCVARSKGNAVLLERAINEETAVCKHLKNDLVRYCKLVNSVK
jgi:hypothetical protein